jgi:hypothetical protein
MTFGRTGRRVPDQQAAKPYSLFAQFGANEVLSAVRGVPFIE